MSRTLQKMRGFLETAKELAVVTEGYTKFQGLDLMDEDDLNELVESVEFHVRDTGVEEIYTVGVMESYVATLESHCEEIEKLKENS